MTAPVLLPGAPVLLDTDDKWASQPLRGRRGIVVSRYDSPFDGYEYVVCIGPCSKPTHIDDCFPAVAFKPDELIAVPAAAASPAYPCCTHLAVLGCPAGCAGHTQPCVACGQPVKDDADRQTARAMNAQTRP